MRPLEIISYNIEVGKKLDDVISWISQAEVSPEIFCFQEFPEHRVSDFAAFLQLRGYEYCYTQSVIIHKTQVGELTAYKKSQLKLIQHKDLALGNYFWERRHKRLRGERSALLTVFQLGGYSFAVANIHLSVFSPHSMRYKQLQLVLETIQHLAENTVIIGDFNYTSLLGVKKLVSFMDEYGMGCVGERIITHKLFRRIPQQLDYVFQKGMLPKELSVHKVPHSDHFPLAVTFSLGE